MLIYTLFFCAENHDRGLSLHGDHMAERHLCLNKFAEIYGEIPLMYSSITAIPLSRALKIPDGVRIVEP